MEYGIINYEGNNKKFFPDQNSSLNKRDDDTVKIKGHNTIMKKHRNELNLLPHPLILKVGCF